VGRVQADTSKMQINAMLLQQAGDFIHAGTAVYEPTLGDHSPNVRTKGGTLALQQQSEQANSHWLDSLAEISMTYEAKVVLDLIPHVYDRPGRVARILDIEDNPKQVILNAPFQMQGKRPMGLNQIPPGQPPQDVKHYDLTKGRYGVTVSVGKAYKSRVDQGKDELGQLFAAEPQLFGLLGDLYLKFADFPGHQEAAERVKRMMPPQARDPEQQQDPQAELEQAKAALQQMSAKLKELEPDRIKADVQIQSTQAKSQADVLIAQTKSQVDLQIARMNNAAKIEIARITAAKEAANAVREDFEERLALGASMVHEAEESALDRQHAQELAQQAPAADLTSQPPSGNGSGL
jgi:hypothetical protein